MTHRPADWNGFQPRRPAKPAGHLETTADTLEALAFDAGGEIELPPGEGWAVLTNRKGVFCAWIARPRLAAVRA